MHFFLRPCPPQPTDSVHPKSVSFLSPQGWVPEWTFHERWGYAGHLQQRDSVSFTSGQEALFVGLGSSQRQRQEEKEALREEHQEGARGVHRCLNMAASSGVQIELRKHSPGPLAYQCPY